MIDCVNAFYEGMVQRSEEMKRDLHQFSHVAFEIFFFFQRSVQSRRADLHNVAVLNEIIFIQFVAECSADCFAVIYCDPTRFVNVASQVPGTCLFDVFYVNQFETIKFYDRCQKFLCALFILFPSLKMSLRDC